MTTATKNLIRVGGVEEVKQRGLYGRDGRRSYDSGVQAR